MVARCTGAAPANESTHMTDTFSPLTGVQAGTGSNLPPFTEVEMPSNFALSSLFEIEGGTRGILDMWFSATHNRDGVFQLTIPTSILAYPKLIVQATSVSTLFSANPFNADIATPLQLYVNTQSITLDVEYLLSGAGNRGTMWWRILEPPPIQTHQPTSSVQQTKSVEERINQIQDGYLNTTARLIERMEALEYNVGVISGKLSRTD